VSASTAAAATAAEITTTTTPYSATAMHRDNLAPIDLPDVSTSSAASFTYRTAMQPDLCSRPPLVWDWDIEHADRKEEAKADAAIHGAPPFQVDRKLLKDIVQEKMGSEVARIKFLGAGTFHKVSLVAFKVKKLGCTGLARPQRRRGGERCRPTSL